MLKVMSMMLIALVINLTIMPLSVSAKEGKAEREAKFAQKVKTEIAKLGTGTDSKVKVKLKNGTKIEGYISEINDEGFVVTNANGKSTSVAYHHAKQVSGRNTKLGIAFAIGLVAVLLILAFLASTS